MTDLIVGQANLSNFLSPAVSKLKNISTDYKSILADELKPEKTFSTMYNETITKHFGQSLQIYYHVMDASSISRENWTHNDFPYEKFLDNQVDESILTWKPSRVNPSQLNSEVQSKLTATLGKHSIIIPPELEKKLTTNSNLRKKVIANIERLYNFHLQPPTFKMPGVKEYGTKIFGSVTILNAKGEVENCVVRSGGTIMGPDEKTLREIELERIKKLKRRELNNELLEQARIEYIMTRDLIIT